MIAQEDGGAPAYAAPSAPARAVLALGAAVLATSQLVLVDAWRAPSTSTLLPSAVAIAVAAWAMWGLPAPAAQPFDATAVPGGGRADPWLRSAVVAVGAAGGALALAALHHRGDGQPSSAYWGIAALWSASLGTAALGFALPTQWLLPGGARAWLAARHRPLSDAATLFAVALLFRLLLLDRVPAYVNGDEGVFGNAARSMALGEGSHMFGTFWANATMYLVPHALLERLIGPSAWALRLPTALGAAIAAPATYALGAGLFGRRVGLAAGALMAANHLHVHFSRAGLGHGLDAALAAVAAWGLATGVLRRSTGRAAVGGLALGLAQYGYVGARLIDLVAAAWVAWLAVLALAGAARAPAGARRAAAAARLPVAPVGAAFLVAVITAAPMVRWALVRPGDYLSRIGAEGLVQSGAAAERLAATSSLGLAARQALDAALAFGSAPATAFYFSRFAALDVVTAALLLLGVVMVLRRPIEPRLAFLGLHIVGGLVTLALARNAAVSLYRVSGVLPAALVLAALALTAVLGALFDQRRTASGRVAALLVGGVFAFHVLAYWRGFAPGCSYWDPLTAFASRVGQITARDAPHGAVFFLGRPDMRIGDFESARYLAERRVWRLPGPGDAGSVAEPTLGPIVPDPAGETADLVYFDVPVGMDPDELARLVAGARRPTLVFAVPSRLPALHALTLALPAARIEGITRCAKDLGSVATWGAAAPGP